MNESVNSGTSSEMTAGNGLAPSVGGGGSQAYGEAWYWDNRYSQDSSTFDWYQKYPSLAPLIRLYVPRRHPILVVGSGNSAFSEGMADDGYDEIVNIDISSVVIEAMQKKYQSRPQLKYMKMDVRDMSAFGTRSFAAVIDKGTLDSLLCGQNSQHNSSKMLEEVWRYISNSKFIGALYNSLILMLFYPFGATPKLTQLMTNYRVLKDKGVYILVSRVIVFLREGQKKQKTKRQPNCFYIVMKLIICIFLCFSCSYLRFRCIQITYGSPNYRLPVLQNLNWTIKLHVIEKLQPGNHNNSSNLIPELTSPVPIPLNVDEQSFPEAAVGINSNVHYIYVCIKDDSGTG
ncbi:S-adenosyl-L-methionine-dependentmethyltransferases superfamily protein [Striga asiatica]|uniref:S-adenosyl-L-methionine-dependentmethyltransferases superfamily protein n=1 Tax=Striga asiatica TaxID=4170 RepID=A0A5A7PFF7_STRAF|nr:S-adenosyl-L-methionine-dependentmethyltransferases superfamily protein [Striga asiatica]